MGAIFLLVVGLAFPLLMNGQSFTNSVLGILFTLGACAWAIRLRVNGQASPSRRCIFTVVFAIGSLWALFLFLQLPKAYRFQNTFNDKMEEIRQKNRIP